MKVTRGVRWWIRSSATPAGGEEPERERRSVEMICVTVEIHEDALAHRVRISALSIERALKIAKDGKTDRRACLVFPIDPGAFPVPEDTSRREAA
jgi:hypothetical protein